MIRQVYPRFLEFAHPSSEKNSKVLVVGIPWAGLRSSRYGAFKGPRYLRSYSDLIESWAEVSGIDLADGGWQDLGDLQVKLFWDSKRAYDQIYNMVRRIISDKRGRKFGFIGGEHSVTLPILKAFKELGREPVVLHFDAHFDLHDQFEGDRYSYACVMRRVIEELGLRVISLGVRTRVREEEEFRRATDKHLLFSPQKLEALEPVLRKAGEIYISFDMDVFQPSLAPGVTNPVGGGFSYSEVMEIFKFLKTLSNSGVEIVSFDLVELNPVVEANITPVLAAEVFRELLGLSILNSE